MEYGEAREPAPCYFQPLKEYRGTIVTAAAFRFANLWSKPTNSKCSLQREFLKIIPSFLVSNVALTQIIIQHNNPKISIHQHRIITAQFDGLNSAIGQPLCISLRQIIV